MAETRTKMAIPPELRAAPPRKVRRYRRKWAPLLMLPYIICGVGVLAYLVAELLLIYATPARDGRIIRLYTIEGGRGLSYRVQYQYVAGSSTFTGSDGVVPGFYQQLQLGQEVRVHAIVIGSRRISEIEKPFSIYCSTHWPLWLIAIIWNLLVLLQLKVRAIPKRLMERGIAVIGKITDKEIIGRDSATARFRFTFNTSAGESITAVEGVAAWRCQDISPGDQAVVVYDPAWPRRAVLYQCSDFHAE
jgi:hypothetical protein